MSLAERIREANTEYQNTFICKLMQITFSPKLSKEDVDALITAINSAPFEEAHVTGHRLAMALRSEGFDVSASAVDRHRRGTCSCTRLK
jgi:hypothetical protein